jgi:hypothetical protein
MARAWHPNIPIQLNSLQHSPGPIKGRWLRFRLRLNQGLMRLISRNLGWCVSPQRTPGFLGTASSSLLRSTHSHSLRSFEFAPLRTLRKTPYNLTMSMCVQTTAIGRESRPGRWSSLRVQRSSVRVQRSFVRVRWSFVRVPLPPPHLRGRRGSGQPRKQS